MYVPLSQALGAVLAGSLDGDASTAPSLPQEALDETYAQALSRDLAEVPTRPFGKTGLTVPVLSLGCGPFMHFNSVYYGRKMWGVVDGTAFLMFSIFVQPPLFAAAGYATGRAVGLTLAPAISVATGAVVVGQLFLMWLLNTEHQQNCDATLRKALDLGFNHLETARMYMTSEAALATSIARCGAKAGDFILQTKVRPVDGVGAFEEKLRRSLEVLRVPAVDLLTLHGLNLPEHVDNTWACLEKLEEIKGRGLAAHIGLATHAPVDCVLPFIESGRLDYLNLHMHALGSYTVPDTRRLVDACARQGMGVFIISPLDKGGHLQKPSDTLRELCRPLHPAEFGLLWCMTQPGVHTVSFGAASPEQFDWQVNAAKLLPVADRLLPTIVRRIRRHVRDRIGDRADAIGARGSARLMQGQGGAPGAMNAYMMTWITALWRGLDMEGFALHMHDNIKTTGNDWCCGGNTLQPTPWERVDKDALRDAVGDDAEETLRELSALHALVKEKGPSPLQRRALAAVTAIVVAYVRLAWSVYGYRG